MWWRPISDKDRLGIYETKGLIEVCINWVDIVGDEHVIGIGSWKTSSKEWLMSTILVKAM